MNLTLAIAGGIVGGWLVIAALGAIALGRAVRIADARPVSVDTWQAAP